MQLNKKKPAVLNKNNNKNVEDLNKYYVIRIQSLYRRIPGKVVRKIISHVNQNYDGFLNVFKEFSKHVNDATGTQTYANINWDVLNNDAIVKTIC